MSYEPFYEGGWQSGESGGTPITPEALNHMDEGIKKALEKPVFFISSGSTLRRYVDSLPATVEEVVDAYFAGKAYFLDYPRFMPHRIQGFTISESAVGGEVLVNVPINVNTCPMFAIINSTEEAFNAAMAAYRPEE